MITIKLQGGIGNQLFQYAAARRLAERLGVGLLIDINAYGFSSSRAISQERPLEITKFDISQWAIPSIRRARQQDLVHAVLRKLPLHWRRRMPGVYWEDGSRFDPKVLGLHDHSRLYGYFQCERYFSDIAPVIRREYQLKDRVLLDSIVRTIAGVRREGRPLVSLHVRRGDYLQIKPDGDLLVPLEKIRAAMSHFSSADFLVFSDDMAWCRAHLEGEIQFSPFGSAVEDLVAMSHCDHHIIANSSFSWWGAWLNPSVDKIVIAPKNWSQPGSNGPGNHLDIYPAGWLLV